MGPGGGPGFRTGARLSIDLGTTNTVAVLSVGGGPPRVVGVDGAVAMPSAVFAAEDGRLVAGREAERLARLAPARFEPNPKRRIDDGALLLGPGVVPVTSALAAVLAKVAAEATRQLGGAGPDEVRLTHPAQWGTARCAVLLAAAHQAGLGPHISLVAEPVAAGAHFAVVTGRVLAPGQAIAIYDLGAGTFDSAVVAAGPHGLTVLAESGLPDLGGLDVDQALLEHLGRQVVGKDPERWGRLLDPRSTEDRRAARALREDVRQAKEALSEHPQTEVALPEPFGPVLVTRTELEELVAPGLRRSVELLAATTRGAGLEVSQLAAVYLVGGSSRIPLVAKLIADRLGIVPTALDQPETAVAFGAHQVAFPAPDPRTRDRQTWRPAYPPPHRPARRGGRAALVSALSFLAVAAVVAVIVLAPWRSDPASSPGSAASAAGPNGKDGFHWSLTRGEVGLFTRLWPAPDGVVLGTEKGLTSYDADTGAVRWSWRVPADTNLCNMSQSTADGFGAVTFGPWSDEVGGAEICDTLQTISIETGEPRWDEPVDLTVEGYPGWLGRIGGTSLSISDTLVTAAYAGENAQDEHSSDLLWVDARTGERLGATDVGYDPVYDHCMLAGYAQALGDRVVAVVVCARFDFPSLLEWARDSGEWRHGGGLDGCGPLVNTTASAYLTNENDRLLVACFAAGLARVYEKRDGDANPTPVSLDGVAVDAVTTVGGNYPPANIITVGDGLFLVGGADGKSTGVVASQGGTSGSGWRYALPGASRVRLMAATDAGATVLVTTPGPATLHTVTGPNRATEGPELPPGVADLLPRTSQAIRVGDYLVCGFSGGMADDTVIGVVRAES